jgi:hypothetical protein
MDEISDSDQYGLGAEASQTPGAYRREKGQGPEKFCLDSL